MASTPGVEPGPHWWEASALNTAPPLLPTLADSSGVSLSLGHTHIGLPYWFNVNFPTSIPATFIWESLPGCIIRFKNFRFRLKFSNLKVHSCSFLNGFKISDIDELVPALKYLDLGLFWSSKLDVKFSRVFIRYKDTR